MFIDTPQNTLALNTREDGITPDGTHYLLRMRRESSNSLFKNWDAVPSLENYVAAAKYLSVITELEISHEQAETLLSLYPHVRIPMAVHNSVSGSDVRDGLNFVAAHFFLACTWPTYGDKVDIYAFTALLKAQAERMGFSISKPKDAKK